MCNGEEVSYLIKQCKFENHVCQLQEYNVLDEECLLENGQLVLERQREEAL